MLRSENDPVHLWQNIFLLFKAVSVKGEKRTSFLVMLSVMHVVHCSIYTAANNLPKSLPSSDLCIQEWPMWQSSGRCAQTPNALKHRNICMADLCKGYYFLSLSLYLYLSIYRSIWIYIRFLYWILKHFIAYCSSEESSAIVNWVLYISYI